MKKKEKKKTEERAYAFLVDVPKSLHSRPMSELGTCRYVYYDLVRYTWSTRLNTYLFPQPSRPCIPFLFNASKVCRNIEPNNTICAGRWVIPWLVRTCFIVDCVSLSIIGKVIFSSGVRRFALGADGGMVIAFAVVDDDELLPPKSLGDLKSFLGGMPSHTWLREREREM